MDKNEKRKIWIIIDHPWQLLLAQAVTKACAYPELEFHLITSNHKYWKFISPDSYLSDFASINFFESVDRANNLEGIVRFIRQVALLKKQAKQLPINNGDIFLILSYHRYMENVITSSWRKNKTVFLCRQDLYTEFSKSLPEILAMNNAYLTKSGYLHYYFLDPILRLKKKIWQYWVRGGKLHGLAFPKSVKTMYDIVFVLCSLNKGTLSQDECYYPYSLLLSSQRSNTYKDEKMIVFLLSAYKRYFNEEQYARFSQILLSLVNDFGSKYRMVLRLHPNGTDETARLNITGWEVNDDPGNSEQFMLRNANKIAACVSIGSIPLLFGFNLGIPSFCYYKAVELGDDIKQLFDIQFNEMPDDFFIRDINKPPSLKLHSLASQEDVKASLEKLYKVLKN